MEVTQAVENDYNSQVQAKLKLKTSALKEINKKK